MKKIIHIAAMLTLLASAACTQAPAGGSFDFNTGGGFHERALYEY